MKIYTLTTVKGNFAGTAEECAAWLYELQPSCEDEEDWPTAIRKCMARLRIDFDGHKN